MKVLIDTCVLAEAQRGHSRSTTAIAELPDESLFLSVLSIGEIRKGISLLEAGKKKRELTSWLATLSSSFSERIIPVDKETAELWGNLSARTQKSGVIIPAIDGLICATALQHGLSIMTRNTKHFAVTGVHVIDPWSN